MTASVAARATVHPDPPPPRPRRRPSGSGFAFLLLLPALAAALAVSLYPLLSSFRLSFRNTSLGNSDDSFIGWGNYQQMFGDIQFRAAWLHTIWFTGATTVLETVLGVVFALVLHEKFKGRGMFRALVLIPWAIPTVVTSKMFQRLFDGQVGLINWFLEKLSITHSYVNFLGEPGTAMWTIISADVWKTTPFMTVLVLAALQTIPGSLLEAARVDGAGPVRTFFLVRLPLIAPAILVASLIRALDAFRIFDLPYVLTGGGPAGSTETLSTLAYKNMFSALQVGYGSAITTTMFITEILIALIFVVFLVRQYRKTD